MTLQKQGESDIVLTNPVLGSFLMGPFYLLMKRANAAAGIYFLILFFTACFSWVIMPFFTEYLVKEYYRSKGWKLTHDAIPQRDKTSKELDADADLWLQISIILFAASAVTFALFILMF